MKNQTLIKKKTKNAFVQNGEELKEKMEKLGLKAETKIKLNLKNW